MDKLASHLSSHGLVDIDFWLQQLKELGVHSKKSLVHLEGDMEALSKLKPKARNSVEEKALLSLMHIPSNSLKNVLLTSTKPTPPKSPCPFPTACKQNQDALALLERLGLTKYYEKRLQLQDALCIRPQQLRFSLGKEKITDPQHLPFLVLHKLMAYDSLCRSDLMPVVEKEDSEREHSGDETDSNSSEEKAQSLDSFCSPENGIHPVDCLLSLIVCSDKFLQQDLLCRMAKCQLAVPLVYSDPIANHLTIPLWGLRSIVKEWEFIKEKDETEKITQTIISYKMPVIAFIRLGKTQQHVKSKSAILNDVINHSHYSYNHFFHRDCQGGGYKPILSEGLIDMCWYLPGTTANAFPDAITFINLHGDAREHPQQMHFLCQISSMCFVLLTEENLELDDTIADSLMQLSSCAGGITVLGSIKIVPKILKRMILINMKKKNKFELKTAIRNRINKKLDWSQSFQSIAERCSIAKTDIFIDEQDDLYKEGCDYSAKILQIVTSCHSSTSKAKKELNVKDTLLPLQGITLWKEWAVLDKEMQRQIHREDKNKSVNEYTEDIRSEKLAIRKRQLEYVESLTPIMQSFIVTLLKLKGPSNKTLQNYFLQCLKLEFDNLSRQTTSKLQHQYESLREELSCLEENNEGADSRIKALKEQLEELQEEIIRSSFGLEHLFRELGQVYEAALESQLAKKTLYNDCLFRLPRVTAELFVDGYPLEIMDGDAAHVPLKWITAVLEETIQMLDDPNIFVLSVLGLQSIGKSTMLNTTFGLHFNVSAGRCTRGAFMQLLPLDNELRTKTNCSYVLIVDTEGLRAPQLDPLKTQNHDNELATFVIGLANMTLINIYGEVPGDMDDILQTSVHAFLRMTQIKLSASCQFVHQNAGDNVSSNVGRAKFTKKLNHFTIEAAKQAKCEMKYKQFNDVIKFNDRSDVHHFRGLWIGDPPMAPINPGYSKSAQEMKLHFIKKLCLLSTPGLEGGGDLHLSAFQVKVQDFWKALLTENFVFSFRNTQEITAFNSLETHYSKWDWEIRESMLNWELRAENEISATDLEENLGSNIFKQKQNDLQVHLSAIFETVTKKLQTFFSGKQSAILAKWRPKFESRLLHLQQELKLHAESHCKRLIASREAFKKIEQDRKHYAAVVTAKIQDHASSLKKEQRQFSESISNRRLSDNQLKKIVKRNLFTLRNLHLYEQQGLITEEQARDVADIISECGGSLTISALPDILFGTVLEPEQVKKILTRGRHTEEELKEEFNTLWGQLIEQILPVYVETANVERETEKQLIEFARAKGYEGQLVAELQGKGLRRYEAEPQVDLVADIHYKPVRVDETALQRVTSYFLPWGEKKIVVQDNTSMIAQNMTKKMLKEARECLRNITDKKANFKPLFVKELLHTVDTAITVESENVKSLLTITHEYRQTVFLMVCGYAIPKFEAMNQSFRERIDPRYYLEKKVRKPLFTQFKMQYAQAKAEETIAGTLCACLEVPIREQVKTRIGAIMVGKMRVSEYHFSNKMALKVKILSDLFKKNDYDSFMAYVLNAEECLQERIKHYTVQYSNCRISTDESRLQASVKEVVTGLIKVVENIVSEVNNTEILEWLTAFSRNPKLISELGNIDSDNLLTGFDSLKQVNLDNFKDQIRTGLQELKETLHASYASIKCEVDMTQWKDEPYEHLADLIGCTEQCPFCGEQCDLLDPNHYSKKGDTPHRTAVHRPSCLAEWRNVKTQVMTSHFCTSLVASDGTFRDDRTKHQPHPYKQYDSIYPEWSIPPDPTTETCLYWKWFVGRYLHEIARTFNAKPANVPRSWLDIKWAELSKSLKDAYKVELFEAEEGAIVIR